MAEPQIERLPHWPTVGSTGRPSIWFTRDRKLSATMEAHVRRLEALRRARIVERITGGVCKVPDDLPERGWRYNAERADGALVELRSHINVKK